MELDKQTIKALAADSRVEILKSLKGRRKIPSELSKELALATSTITEHLKNLENVGLVEKKETGHKWIYYQLTSKGSNIVQPKYPVNVILSFAIGLMLVVGGSYYYFLPATQLAAIPAMEKTASSGPPSSDFGKPAAGIGQKKDVSGISPSSAQKEISEPIQINKLEADSTTRPVILILVGAVFVVFGAWKFSGSRKNLNFESVNL